MPRIELKPCPFCGGPGSFENRKPDKNDPMEKMLFPKGVFRATCRNSGCWNKGPLPNNWFGRKEAAAEVWNRRAQTQGEEDGNP